MAFWTPTRGTAGPFSSSYRRPDCPSPGFAMTWPRCHPRGFSLELRLPPTICCPEPQGVARPPNGSGAPRVCPPACAWGSSKLPPRPRMHRRGFRFQVPWPYQSFAERILSMCTRRVGLRSSLARPSLVSALFRARRRSPRLPIPFIPAWMTGPGRSVLCSVNYP